MTFQMVRLPPDAPPSDRLAQVFDGNLGAVVVPGLFSPAELQPVVEALAESKGPLHHPLLRTEVSPGRLTSLGMPISRFGRSDSFFDTADAVVDRLEALFNHQLSARIGDAIAALSGGQRPTAARAPNGRSFAPWNLRQVPEGGFIPLHAENHHTGWPGFRALGPDQLASSVISFYILARAPDEGGELEVLEACAGDPSVQLQPTGMLHEHLLDGVARHTVPLTTGDLVVFDGGRHVHRVRPVAGVTTRVTIGGFLSRGSGGGLYAFS